MKRPIMLIAPGLAIALIGAVTIFVLTAFDFPDGNDPAAPGTTTTGSAGGAAEAAGEQDPYLIVDGTRSLLPSLGNEIRKIDGVRAVVEVRTATKWLAAWVAPGEEPRTAPANYFVPVDVAALDPAQYHDYLPEDLRDRAASMGPTGALLSQTSSQLRQIPATGSLAFDSGQHTPVTGVVPDHLANNHEVLVSLQKGAELGITRPSYLLVALHPGADAPGVDFQIDALVPPGNKIRIRGSANTGLPPLSPLLSMAELKAELGEFSARPASGRRIEIHQEWIDANTVMTRVPLLLAEFRCHKTVVKQMEAAMREIDRQGLGTLIDPSDFGGCFSSRYISFSPYSNLSRHSWGAAFDINVQGNLYGATPTMDLRIVEIVEAFGFSWGGRWDYPDGMHFEFVKTVP